MNKQEPIVLKPAAEARGGIEKYSHEPIKSPYHTCNTADQSGESIEHMGDQNEQEKTFRTDEMR